MVVVGGGVVEDEEDDERIFFFSLSISYLMLPIFRVFARGLFAFVDCASFQFL